jgi:tripartite-type tricarboxylate transporter receptor subunit TctC
MDAAETQRLAQAVQAALQSPALRERFRHEGLIPMASGQAEFGSFVQSEMARWAKIVSTTGAKAE